MAAMRLNDSGNPAITFRNLLNKHSDLVIERVFMKVLGIDVKGVPRGQLWSLVRGSNERITKHALILERLEKCTARFDKSRHDKIIGQPVKMHAWIVEGQEGDMDLVDVWYTGKVVSFRGCDMYTARKWKIKWDQYDHPDDKYMWCTFTEVMQYMQDF